MSQNDVISPTGPADPLRNPTDVIDMACINMLRLRGEIRKRKRNLQQKIRMTNNRLRRLLKLLDIDKVIAIQPYYAKKKEAQEVRTQIGPAKIALDEADLECRKLSTIISEAEVDAVLNSAIPGSPKALSGEITKNAWKAMHKAYQNKVNRKAELNRLINKYQRLVLEQSALLEPHRKTLMHVNYYEFFKLSETLVNEVERRTFMITELHRQYDVERMHLKEAFAIAQSKP